jgi:hypothetical protein
MTRRDFALFVGMMSVAMVAKVELIDGGTQTRMPMNRDHHIRNKRLFNFAAGNIRLLEWEQEHLHRCATCQTMACVLIRTISEFPDSEFKDVRI